MGAHLLSAHLARSSLSLSFQREGLEMMTQVASLDPSVYEAVGPVDQPPEELNGATEVIGSAQYNVGRAYYEGQSTYAGKSKA